MSSLSHHGIKGQRWGVRRYQNKDGTRTALGKMRLEKDITIKAGTNLNRVTGNEHEVNQGYVYMSIISEDHDIYKQEASGGIYDRETGELITKIYDTQHTVTKDIRVPSFSNSIKAFEKVMETQDIDEIAKEVGDGFGSDSEKHAEEFRNNYLNRDKSANLEDAYYAFTTSLGNSDKNRKLLFDELKSKGYDAIWDENDRYEGWMKTPLIIFERGEHTEQTSAKLLKHTSIGGTMYIEGNALILGDSSYLEHHGILGQKWGVRRFQNKDGTRTAAGKAREDRRVLKKGTTVKRTSYGMYDETYDNKKYVSTNDDDAGKWSRYIGEARARQGAVVFENEYKLTRDVAVATGKDICKIIDSEFKNADATKLKEDTDYAARALRQDLNNMSREERVSLNFAMQTQSGKKIVKLLKKHGYDALEDDHGKNVSKDPVIILDPGKNMKRTRVTANTRYYFDYINHTSIDDSPHLSHHGIKGQRWGVRRFQNKDGTRTAAGKKRDTENLKSSQEAKNVKSKIHSYINKQLSSEDLDTGKSNYDFASDLIKDPDFEKVIMPVVQDIRQTKAKYGNKEPYEFTGDEHNAYMNDISRIDNKTGELAITIGLAEKGESHKKSTPPEGEYERVDMFRYALARYLDEHSPDGYSDEGDWIYHTSIGGTMYIEGNALILGDSSYLSHHGIRGQRWGVRRFQNRDGSLTNAGRKRLGYATKGAVQTVGKAFKAGVKAGGNAVKAVKAHHEAAEAKKKEKKKEKASKTRLGVMANKDLFTNEEIRKLNERFKLEDEMKMATLQKGVEIAKAVGTIAQNVGTMAKAYEDVTGQSLSPIKRKAAEEKAKQDAEDRKRKLAKEDAETKRAEDKEKRDIEDRERRIKLEDEDRVRKQAREDADAKRAENAEKRAQAKEQRDSSMAVELQRKAKAAADEQEHKAVKAKAESRSAILDVLGKIDKIQDHDDDDHNNPPGGGIDTWDDDDYLNFFKKTGIIHSDISDPSIIQNGVLFVDSSYSLAHHGVKGQRWGVRRFQNEDGSLTDKGRKHYEKKLAKAERKKVAADAARGYLERTHGFAVTSAAVLSGAAYAALMVASAANPATIALGTAVVAAMYGGAAHLTYSVNEAWEGRGSKKYERQANEYREKLKQSDMEEGMYHVENGTLFINAGEPYLEHHGVLGMKWGKHLMAGKGVDAEGGGGGGFAEDDEKLKEMAKKAGMSVAEYRTKMAGKLGGAASKVGEKVYDAAGGSHKKNAEGWRKMAREESNAARASEKSSHENSAKAASQDRKYGSGGDVYRRAADSDKENAKTHHSNAKARSERAASEQAAYEKSLAGKYDKMKADRARKKSAKEKKRLLTQTSAEAKRISVKDKHLVINGNRSSGTRGLAVGDTGEKPKSFKEKAYNALGGKYKTQASEAHREMITARNDADDKARRANAQGRAANANKKAGNVREYMANKEGARQLDAEAKGARVSQWEATKKANSAQWKYDHSLAGIYDKATGKYKQTHKKTAIPKTMDRWMYEYKDGPNSKLFNNGKGKAKTAKEQAKAEVWNAADHQIKAKEYNDVANSQGGNANYYGQAYKNAAEREVRLAEGSYRRAAALGKQASRETSTSSRPRARKKKHTSGGSGVTVRRPGRKPVSRTKRVTQSGTGVKRRGATGTGARVRRGA